MCFVLFAVLTTWTTLFHDLKLIMYAWPNLPKELRLQIANKVLEIII